MSDSVFTKIINNEIPSHRVYEDDKTIAILTIEPYLPGHTLVIPKIQIDQFDDLPDEDYAAVFDTVRKVTKRLKKSMAADRVVTMIIGFDVPHAHIHLIPVTDNDKFMKSLSAHINKEEPYLYSPSNEELAAMADKIRLE